MHTTTAPDTVDTAVRIITDGGDLIDLTAYRGSEDAWNAFTAVIPNLQDGEIAQLIEDDLIAAEHNSEYHGTAALDVADYS